MRLAASTRERRHLQWWTSLLPDASSRGVFKTSIVHFDNAPAVIIEPAV